MSLVDQYRDETLTRSQRDWLRVREHLQRHRYEFGKAAADLYPGGARVAGTPLLSRPEWLPARTAAARWHRPQLHPGRSHARPAGRRSCHARCASRASRRVAVRDLLRRHGRPRCAGRVREPADLPLARCRADRDWRAYVIRSRRILRRRGRRRSSRSRVRCYPAQLCHRCSARSDPESD